MPAPFDHPIIEPAAWTAADLAANRRWEITLAAAEVSDLEQACTGARALPLERITTANFPLPHCQRTIARIREELRSGRGIALLHGFPVEGRDLGDIERMYWGFCAHLGTGLTQNGDGNLIHYVTEGRLRPNQGTRGVGNPGKVSLHVDLADVVSLLCVRQPEDSPPSRLASSLTVHNLVRERAPHLLPRLYAGFPWDRQNEHDPAETPTTGYRVPVFSTADGTVSCRYNRNWMTKAADRAGGFSAEETELLDLFDALAAECMFEFPFNPGDIQFANNYTTLHGRAPHAPAQSEDTTRLLMRIWTNIEDFRPFADEAIVRNGIIRHGRLGWTAAQLAAGLEGKTHARRTPDLAPA
ncbi:MAG: TauD/TfdA family dioxygenase [Alphaproteobacteria bacterium]|nr:TauD/TfdA family dioxygenase [Alphaproteobacteria bacterium]MCB9930040.1 TauD/TfdA family dioxygenase [Alphaproteobacteria bacterium]